MNKMIDDLFFEGGLTDPEGAEIEPICLRLRNGDDGISKKEKELLLEFTNDLAQQVCKKEFDLKDIDLFVRILHFLGSYSYGEYHHASWLFTRMSNDFCIGIEKVTRPKTKQ